MPRICHLSTEGRVGAVHPSGQGPDVAENIVTLCGLHLPPSMRCRYTAIHQLRTPLLENSTLCPACLERLWLALED